MRNTLAIAFLTASLAACIRGQTTTATPAFDVASVKMSPPNQGRDKGDMDNGRISLRNYPMVGILAYAYNLNFDRIAGGPEWLNSQNYDIDATFPPETNGDTVRLMMQNLLAERFKVAVHHEQKPAPVYALVVGKKAPRLVKATGDDARDSCDRHGLLLTCELHHATMTEFAESIPHWLSQNWLGMPVVDQTDIQGAYHVTLTWTMTNRRDDTVDLPGLSLFDAIEEQLGLKLEQRKAPFDRLLIDRIERVPVAN
jgi:uncharacterized protein (TIGR03435 family)